MCVFPQVNDAGKLHALVSTAEPLMVMVKSDGWRRQVKNAIDDTPKSSNKSDPQSSISRSAIPTCIVNIYWWRDGQKCSMQYLIFTIDILLTSYRACCLDRFMLRSEDGT